MSEIIDSLREVLRELEPRSALDILIIAVLVFAVLRLLRGTTAMTLLRGALIILLVAVLLGRLFDLTVVNWLVRNSLIGLVFAALVIFQPEIRRGLERVGRRGGLSWMVRHDQPHAIDAIVEATRDLARRRHGALMVLERDTGLKDIIETGVRVDAAPSAELLSGIFYPNSPLHDKAVVLSQDRLVAASCTLPLSVEGQRIKRLGMRHRAALGITERTDAVSVAVSEETGRISLAVNGAISEVENPDQLRILLTDLVHHAPLVSLNGRNGK
jgi:diadenylate cyclase